MIAAYNDWIALDGCLASIARQEYGPGLEVIVVDDGSDEPAPQSIRRWIDSPAPSMAAQLVRQSHAGISAARNHGIRISQGEVALTVDADCRLRAGCLAALDARIHRSPEHAYFQLRLIGSRSSLTGRAEDLRLAGFQEHALQPGGRIRYLNTAGFAIRRSRVNAEAGLFDPVALRGEDTLLLSRLMEAGDLPLFVPEAVVQHCVELSLTASLRKALRSAYLEGRAYEVIATKGVRIRVTQRERLNMLVSLWRKAGQDSIGRAAWFVLVGRQALQRIVSVAYKFMRRLGIA